MVDGRPASFWRLRLSAGKQGFSVPETVPGVSHIIPIGLPNFDSVSSWQTWKISVQLFGFFAEFW